LQNLILVVAIAYVVEIVLFASAALIARYRHSAYAESSVSVIIAARNEEANIRQCLLSLASSTYPARLLEVIVVDDHSTDGTSSVVREFCARHENFKLVAAVPGTGHLRGKTNAVTQGIEASTGEILLFTDADCTVPPGWVEETVRYYTDESVGLVAGFTALRTSNWFTAMQALDWFVLFTVAAGAVRLRFPVTAVGNNLSVRRKAYDAVGGYRSLPFSVTEDYALFHGITSTTRYSAKFPIDPHTLVESGPCITWKELYEQKTRWFTGGRDMRPAHFFIFGIAYLLNLLILIALVTGDAAAFFLGAGAKAAADFLLTIPPLLNFRRWSLLRYFPQFVIYYFCYVLLFPLVVLIGKEVIWKERSFSQDERYNP
jgi:cellulose synthase/poly-beta-1,6-N-acetylglucosamine synthase-like glycosyltransferase